MNRRKLFAAVGLIGPAAASARALAAAPAAADPVDGKRLPVRMKVGCQQGPTSEELLRFFARHGVRNICGSFGDRPGDGPLTVEELAGMRDLCARHGISLDLVRLHFLRPRGVDSRGARSAIVLGQSPERDRDIDDIQQTIRNCARAGIPGLTYNLTALGVLRTEPVRGRGGATFTAWRLAEAGDTARQLTRAGRLPADVYWERITYFLQRVVPVATEHKVRLACHPQDPGVPPGFRGIDAVLGTVDGLKRFVSIAESPYHGLNFCQGTVSEMLADPAREIFDVIRYFGRRKKIFNVHFRNIKGKRNDFEERFPDDGDIDFVKALQVYREVGYQHMLMPDHAPVHPDDPNKRQAFAYCYGYIRGLLQAAASAATTA
jgi:mannonate dehydratase